MVTWGETRVTHGKMHGEYIIWDIYFHIAGGGNSEQESNFDIFSQGDFRRFPVDFLVVGLRGGGDVEGSSLGEI